jgi:hypothetical protein
MVPQYVDEFSTVQRFEKLQSERFMTLQVENYVSLIPWCTDEWAHIETFDEKYQKNKLIMFK